MKIFPNLFRICLFGMLLFTIQNCTPKTTASISKDKKEMTNETVELSTETSEQVSKTAEDWSLVRKDIPVDPSIRMGTLPNGLKYYIQKNQKPENRAELRLAVSVGSIMEDDDQQGLAHFVEHMAFNGSTNFKKNELVDYLESVGTKFGPDLNAYTSFDETVYMLQVITDDEEKLNKGMTVLQDWAGGISFDHEEIDKERGVVVSEWRTRLSPDQRMQKVYFPKMYYNSQYAQRLPIGKPEIIENADYETVKRFYKDWYRPNLMAVVVVGDIDVDAMEADVQKRFGQLNNPETPRNRTKFNVPKHKETIISVCSDKEAPFTRVRLMYKHDHIEVNNLDDYRSQLVRNLYNRMMNARLDELANSAEPPFSFSYTGYGSDVGDIDSYYCYAFVPEGGSKRGLEVLLEENKRVQEHGFTPTELERAKLDMTKDAEKGLKEADKTDSRRLAMRYVYNFLENNPIPSPQQTLDLYEKYLPNINIDEINKLTDQWITDENRVVVITNPEKEGVPILSEDEVAQVLEQSKTKTVEPYVDVVIDEPLMAEKLDTVAISNEKMMEEIGVTEYTLANGIKVVLKPTDFKNDEIQVQAYSPGGTSLYSDEDYFSARSAARIINDSGLGNFDMNQLNKYLTGKQVSVTPYIYEMYEGFRGNASPDDLETMMQMIYKYCTAPRKDQEAFQSYITKEKAIYKNLLSNPQYYFYNQLSKIKYDNHPRRGWPTEESLDKIDLNRVHQIYSERFGDASDFTFTFVGNFDIAEMKAMTAKYLGNLPAQNRTENWKDVNANFPTQALEKDLVKGQAPKSYIDMTFHGDFDWTPKNRYLFKSMVDVLRIKMRESMREDKGGVYGVRVSGNTYQYPNSEYSINISFNSDPEMAQELIETAMKDIENAKLNGAEDKDLTKVKETQKQSMIKDLKENRFWIQELEKSYKNDSDPNKINLESLEEAMQGLNSDEIKQAANQYFDMNRFIKVVMTPEPDKEN